jgi:hypothetical protein
MTCRQGPQGDTMRGPFAIMDREVERTAKKKYAGYFSGLSTGWRMIVRSFSGAERLGSPR